MQLFKFSLFLFLALPLLGQPVPPPATQAEVDAGVNRFKYVTPFTLANSPLAGGPTNGITAEAATNIVQGAISSGNLGTITNADPKSFTVTDKILLSRDVHPSSDGYEFWDDFNRTVTNSPGVSPSGHTWGFSSASGVNSNVVFVQDGAFKIATNAPAGATYWGITNSNPSTTWNKFKGSFLYREYDANGFEQGLGFILANNYFRGGTNWLHVGVNFSGFYVQRELAAFLINEQYPAALEPDIEHTYEIMLSGNKLWARVAKHYYFVQNDAITNYTAFPVVIYEHNMKMTNRPAQYFGEWLSAAAGQFESPFVNMTKPFSYNSNSTAISSITFSDGSTQTTAGGGGGSQTPWASDINAAGFSLTNGFRLRLDGGTGERQLSLLNYPGSAFAISRRTNAPAGTGTTNYYEVAQTATARQLVGIHSVTDGQVVLTNRTVTGSGETVVLSDSPLITTALGVSGLLSLSSDPYVRFSEHSSAPGTPPTANVSLYAKADGLLYSKDDAGTETLVSGGSGSSSSNYVTIGVGSIAVTNSSSVGAVALNGTNSIGVTIQAANSNSVPITNIVGLLHKASASVIVLDCNHGNRFQVTNRLGQGTTFVVTNLAQGQEITIKGSADGTSRSVTVVPQLGFLVRDFDAFGVAAALNKAITATNGNTFEINIATAWENGTNWADVVTRQATY